MITNYIRSVFRLMSTRIALFLALSGFSLAYGQQPDSLRGYLKEAAMNNPALKAKYLLYQAALEKVPQAGSLPDPELEFGFFINKMELMEGYQLADFRLMQMSPWFGTLKAAKDEASKMAVARFLEVQSVKNDLILQVKISWYGMFKTKRELASSEKSLALLKTLERMALVRFRAGGDAPAGGSSIMTSTAGGGDAGTSAPAGQTASGMKSGGMSGQGNPMPSNGVSMANSSTAPMGNSAPGGMLDILRVQMEIGELEDRIASLKDRLIAEKARFNSYLSRKGETEVYLPDSLPVANLPGLAMQMTDSIVNNPMVKMYEADREANIARLNMATKMGYPMIGIGLNYSLIQKFPDGTSMMNGKDMFMPMVNATLPIYRKKYRSLQQEAIYLRDASAASAQNAINDLTASYSEALKLYQDAARRAALFTRQAKLAEKSISLMTTSFSAGGTGFEEILRMQQQLLDYEYRQVEAVVDSNIAGATIHSIISSN